MCLAVPGKVVEIREEDGTRMGQVDFGGVLKDVCLEYLPDLQVGGEPRSCRRCTPRSVTPDSPAAAVAVSNV